MVNQVGTAAQQTDYYPFGMVFNEYSNVDNKYLYNGKEMQRDAIGNGLLDWYDYGARMYDAALGLWHTIDSLAEKMPSWGGYVYAFNNPLRFIDLAGLIPWPVTKKHNNANRIVVSGMYRNFSGSKHGAADIAHLGTSGQISGGKISATHEGTVAVSKEGSPTAGNYVVITNGDIRTLYMHMEGKPLVEAGSTVKEGGTIGYVGSTGKSQAPHVHYAMQQLVDGEWVAVNPVVGDPDKVNSSDNVELKDPQKMINERDGINESQGGTRTTGPDHKPSISFPLQSLLTQIKDLLYPNMDNERR